MAGRNVFAWQMFAAAEAQDNKEYSARSNAKARRYFDPLLDLTEQQFKDR